MYMAQRMDPSELEYIAGLCRRNALHVVKLGWTTHPLIGFDVAGVRWLDRYINEARQTLASDLVDEFVQLMGCYYGECLLATFGGTWAVSNDQLSIRMEPLGHTFPFNAVAKQVQHGADASIATAFMTAVEYLTEAA